MTVNMGMIDRVVRVVVGLLLVAWAIPIGVFGHRLELDRLDRDRAAGDGSDRILPGLYVVGLLDLSDEAGLKARVARHGLARHVSQSGGLGVGASERLRRPSRRRSSSSRTCRNTRLTQAASSFSRMGGTSNEMPRR